MRYAQGRVVHWVVWVVEYRKGTSEAVTIGVGVCGQAGKDPRIVDDSPVTCAGCQVRGAA
jgi:hypothetical protein